MRAEMLGERTLVAESAFSRDFPGSEIGFPQQATSRQQPGFGEEFVRSGGKREFEFSLQLANREADQPCELSDIEWFLVVLSDVVHGFGDVVMGMRLFATLVTMIKSHDADDRSVTASDRKLVHDEPIGHPGVIKAQFDSIKNGLAGAIDLLVVDYMGSRHVRGAEIKVSQPDDVDLVAKMVPVQDVSAGKHHFAAAVFREERNSGNQVEEAMKQHLGIQ